MTSLCFGESTDPRVLKMTFQSLNYWTAVWTEQDTYSTGVGLSFLICTIKKCSIIAGVLSPNIHGPTFSTIYLIQEYGRIIGDMKKNFGEKRGSLSLFAFKFLRLSLIPSSPKLALVFLRLSITCWLQVFANASCSTQVLSSSISLTVLPDSFSLGPAFVTQRLPSDSPYLTPPPGALFYFLPG